MISHKRKCLFIHIPKCAGQSIEDVFIRDCGLTWNSREPLLLRKNDNPLVGPPWLAHLTYAEYVKYGYISKELAESYRRFTIVRNPYSRLQSIYSYRGYEAAMPFEYFVDNVVPKESQKGSRYHYFFRPQVDYIKNEEGKIEAVDMFRLEEIDRVIPYLQDMGLNVDNVPHVNKAIYKGVLRNVMRRVKIISEGYCYPSPYFKSNVKWSERAVKIVNSIYSEDFSKLGYSLKSS